MNYKNNIHKMEQLSIEKKNILNKLTKYVSTEAQKKELHKIEEDIFSMILPLCLAFLKEALLKKGTGKRKEEVKNGDNEIVPFNKTRKIFYQSIFGKLEIFRAYYWEKGKKGVYPLDKELNLPDNNRSYLLDKWIQMGITEQAYHKAISCIDEFFKTNVSKLAEEDMTKKICQNIDQYYREEAELLEEEGAIIIASADCKGVAMVPDERPLKSKGSKIRRGKGEKKKGLRKDAVVTADYSIDPIFRTAKDVIDTLMSVNSDKTCNCKKKPNQKWAKNKRVVATMYGKEKAFKDLADRIKKRDSTELTPIFLLIDGERALEKGLIKELKKRKWKRRIKGVCLDIIHAVEYLWEAGSALYGEKNPKRHQWVKKKLLEILDDKIGYVIGGLRQVLNKRKDLKKSKIKILKKVIGYFDNHKHMMSYKKYLKEGLPISTGVIEGACGSLVKNRMDCSGMKWTKEGANAVLGIRSIKQNGYWENFWEYFIKKEKERLYY